MTKSLQSYEKLTFFEKDRVLSEFKLCLTELEKYKTTKQNANKHISK